MAVDRYPSGLTPSLIDRLIDPESEGTSWRRGYSVEEMIDAVRRDLEDLLNSHRVVDEGARDYPEARDSLVTYGLPDLASIRSSVGGVQARVCAVIEETIARFEPRLTDVRVSPVPEIDPRWLKLQFEINGTLRMEPSPDVAFLTVLKLTTGETSIHHAGG
jgi:type VI secretion system protein ImpF